MIVRVLIIFVTVGVAVTATGVSALRLMQGESTDTSASNDLWSDVSGPRKNWVPVGSIDTAIVAENSGIVASRQYPGVYWVHSDSFNPPSIFAVKESGAVLAKVDIAAINVDWEDIAIDDMGFLYIADIGNNMRMPIERKIYKIAEPDPYAGDGQAVKPNAIFKFLYPNKPFDAEGFFVFGQSMYLVSRHDRNAARIYRLDPDNEGNLTLHEVSSSKAYRASGADLSRDGSRLAVCTPQETWIHTVGTKLAIERDKPAAIIRYPYDLVEGCCFEGEDLILSNEKGHLFRIRAEDLSRQIVFVRPSENRAR